MEAPRLLTASAGDPRKPFVLIGVAYISLCVAAVWLDHKIKMRRYRKRQEREKAGTPVRGRPAQIRKEDPDDDA